MKSLLVLIILIVTLSCSAPKKVDYSFFAAGHTYGNPMDESHPYGLFKPFKEKITFINEDKTLKMGFLLGDVVWKPSYWDAAIKDISLFQDSIHIVRGNHDGSLKSFQKRFRESYYCFSEDKDLFIVLDGNIDSWSISGDQLIFLKNTIRNKGKKARNIFVFVHQIIWWTPSEYSKPFPNSTYGRGEEVNYWSEIEPLLTKSGKPIFLFGGDLGAFSSEQRKKRYPTEYLYFKKDNITYIGTGMGGGIRDNFVIVDVLNSGEVNFRLIHLNGEDINGLGKLEDYSTNDSF
ncbi:metallophosphoesterase family protein [Winogradskyella pulchriflava]|uniref:Metallophosphoesterase family protein n=1 Tax=Winogradskyella pulchriflava TaxID=1110688 RepID=A0ABV6Q560_9FLAO